MRETTLLALSFSAFLIVTVPTVYGQQPYVGGYFTNSRASATKAFMGTDFQGTNPAVIPANNWLGSVVSITGQISTGNCPCGYQSGFALFPDGTVYYVPQTWGVDSMGNPFQISFAEANVGTTSSISLEGIIRYDSSISSVRFTGFAYNSQRQVDYNSPSIYNNYSINTGDTNFYYGNDVVGSLTIKNFPVCS